MAMSQMEPVSARRAFPCFDEPNMKAKFTMTIGKFVLVTIHWFKKKNNCLNLKARHSDRTLEILNAFMPKRPYASSDFPNF